MPWNLIKTLIFTVFVPGTVGAFIPWRWREPGPQTVSPFAWLGLAPVTVGATVYLWCAWDFATFGRGTPLPLDAPKQLVVHGLYRFVRNPMYVGVLLAILGQALCFESGTILSYALAVAVFFHCFVVLYEEPALRHKFGESYESYCETVSRWIPKPAVKREPAR